MCWQDGFGVGKAKNSWETIDLANTFPPDQNHTITRQDGEPSRMIQIELISVVSDFKNAFICLISSWVGYCCSFGQKRNVFFIPTASHLLDVSPHFLWLDLPQRLRGCFVLFHVTICCRWDGHVTLLLTVAGLGSVAAQDVGARRLLPVRWWAIISAGLIIFTRDWCTGQLNSPGDCKLQAAAPQWKSECIWTAAIVASQHSIDCYYGIRGEL